MAKTLTLCSCSLVALGVMMTAFFIFPRNTGEFLWLLVTAWTFVPFILVFGAIKAAEGIGQRTAVLVATLFVVGYGFSIYFDRTFIHRSTLDLSPIMVPLVQAFVAGATWLEVWQRRLSPK